jgi:hypothetical protein
MQPVSIFKTVVLETGVPGVPGVPAEFQMLRSSTTIVIRTALGALVQ